MRLTLPKQPSLPTNMVEVPEDERKAFGFEFLGVHATLSWEKWAEVHKALGQELAKRMREYGGPAEQDEPPPGGTPVLMRMAA